MFQHTSFHSGRQLRWRTTLCPNHRGHWFGPRPGCTRLHSLTYHACPEVSRSWTLQYLILSYHYWPSREKPKRQVYFIMWFSVPFKPPGPSLSHSWPPLDFRLRFLSTLIDWGTDTREILVLLMCWLQLTSSRPVLYSKLHRQGTNFFHIFSWPLL